MTNRYLRSVNIAHDLSQSGHELHGYMATPLVLQTVARIMRGCDDASNGRAFSIIGPYGTGKSAFGVFLAHWVAANPDARDSLWKQHTLMEQRIVPFDSAQLLPIPLLVKATTLRQAIVATLHQHLSHIAPLHPLGGQLLQASENPDLPPEEVATYLGLFTEAVLANTQYHGVMLIIDELGQHLAHIHRSGDSRDLFVLQTIAELAARSGDTPIMVITILHQTFERYSTTASVAQQTEWAKVQGRYVDVVFQEPQSQMMRFVANVMQHLNPRKRPAIVKQWAETGDALGLRPAELKLDEWRWLVKTCYPLHPTVVVALPLLFRTLAQNERSLFAFLTAQERGSLSEFLAKNDGQVPYLLHDLAVYIEQTLGPGLFGRARGRPWVELSEVLHRLRNGDPLAQQIVSTIGTLAALNDDRNLRPSREMLVWALGHNGLPELVDTALLTLQKQQLVVYSVHRDRFRLTEASDINLDQKIQVARGEFATQRDIVALLTRYATLEPVIAYRHSYYSGTLRHFVVRFVDAESVMTHSTAQHSTAQHSTAQHSTAQHSTMVKFGMSLSQTMMPIVRSYSSPATTWCWYYPNG